MTDVPRETTDQDIVTAYASCGIPIELIAKFYQVSIDRVIRVLTEADAFGRRTGRAG